MSQPTRGLATNGSKVRQLRAQADELMQHLDDAAQLEDIQLQVDAAAPELQPAQQAPKFTPTLEQQRAIDGLVDFARSGTGGNFAALLGPAGTGKSTISRLVRQALTDAGFSVGLAAPTHKACQVLADACGVSKDETATFASLLALREKKVKDQVEFVRDWRRKPRIDEHDIWLCDEASMLEPQMLEMIQQEADFWDRFIFIGDPAQLPPVTYGKVSPALRLTPRFELKRVMRHDGAVLDAATAIRQTAGNTWRTRFHQSVIGDGSAIYTYEDKRKWQHAILDFAAEHHADPDAFRVLCFRRMEVAKINLAIRRHVFGRDADPFLQGERLITVEPIKDPADPDGFPLYGTSRELVIQQATSTEQLLPSCSDGIPYRCWQLIVLAEGPGELPKRITVIDPSHEGKLAVTLGQLAGEAKEHPGEQGAWDPYWELRDAFAQVQPAWAMTVHKAQGSQFRHVFISPDLDTAPGPKSMRRHLWYTGFTRSQQAVHLIADPGVQG